MCIISILASLAGQRVVDPAVGKIEIQHKTCCAPRCCISNGRHPHSSSHSRTPLYPHPSSICACRNARLLVTLISLFIRLARPAFVFRWCASDDVLPRGGIVKTTGPTGGNSRSHGLAALLMRQGVAIGGEQCVNQSKPVLMELLVFEDEA